MCETLVNAFIQSKGMIWLAGESAYSDFYFMDKMEEGFGEKYQTYGFEYYKAGIFEIYALKEELISDPTYNIVDYFDWRNKHDANIEGTPYYGGDGTGWMTPPKCQTGCIDPSTGLWVCKDICNELGITPIQSGACAGFTAVGMVEAMINIFFNNNIELDLSEQQAASNQTPTAPYCGSTIGGGIVSGVLDIVRDYELVDEECFPFEGINIPCDDRCDPPLITDAISINDHSKIDCETYGCTLEEIKKTLILNGPLGWAGINPWANDHAEVWVGFDVIKEGDVLEFIGTIGPGSDYIGLTYFITKGSGGVNGTENDGFFYRFLYDFPEQLYYIIPDIYNQVNYNRLCRDEDNDGFNNWGIGSPPTGCEGEMDGNDNNYILGPMDEYGFCRIINDYFTSFEEHYDGWKQSGDDDFDWIKHSGHCNDPWQANLEPTTGAAGTTFYMYIEGSKVTNPIGKIGYFESPLIDFDVDCSYELSFCFCKDLSEPGGEPWGGLGSMLEVQTSVDAGQTWNTIWGVYDEDSWDDWQEVTLILLPSINKLRFASTVGIVPPRNNIAIDHISINEIDNADPIIISGEYNLINDYHACNDIIIEPTGKLTIGPNCTLIMPTNKKIIVERSGELEINGGKITADGNGYWTGIEIWGTNGQPQHPSYQGLVYINSGGTIEKAVCGIRTFKADGDPAYSGGIILANNANFINNVICASFYPYTVESMSYFENSDFLINDELPSGFAINNFISLKGIDGVDFRNISVNDIRSTIPIDQKATGIYSVDSKFYVRAKCLYGDPCVQWDNSTFMNLKYGIYALRSISNLPFSVERTDFINNLRGIYASGADLLSVTLSSFNTYDFPALSPEHYGLYLDNCTGYVIEENYFYNDAILKQGIGLIVNQSGGENNMIYNNNFENLSVAALAQNENRSTNGLTGLQFKCNQFELNTNDLAVTYNLPFQSRKAGIASKQGSHDNAPNAPAGNLFSHTGPMGTFSDINNQSQHIIYYYHVNELYPLRPWYYTTLTVTPTANEEPNAYWDPEESCPSHLGGGGGTGPDNGNREEMLSSGQKEDSIRNILNAIEDGGNTIELTQEVDWSIPPESMDIFNELMNKSPYLTDTVIGAAIEKENVFANAMIRDVMVANPQSAKDDELIEKLDERNNPMPDYMFGQILQGRNLVSVYEELQSKLMYYSQQRAYAYHKIVHEYLTDSLNSQSSIDSLIQLFAGEHSLKAKYSLTFLYIYQGDYASGLTTLNQVPSQFDLTEEEQAEHQNLIGYCNLLAGFNGSSPDSAMIQLLFDIEAQETGIASAYARNLLISLDEMSYEEPIILPDMLKSSKEIRYEQLMLTAHESRYLEIFPNPSKDHIIISWKLDTAPNNAKISISDNAGKCLCEWTIEEIENQQVFDARNLKPGVYIVTLYGNNKQMESTKFTIVK